MGDTTEDRTLAGRRTVLAGLGAVGTVAALAACGSSNGQSNGASGDTGNGATTDPPTGAATSAAATSGSTSGSGASSALAKTTDIPVGSGKIFDKQNVVVTQPTAGKFKAFSATCTHQGCQVSTVQNGTINCPCHGSQFSVADGSVKGGPAPRPLSGKTVTVSGENITVA
jgi:Rieske Fe-S protein